MREISQEMVVTPRKTESRGMFRRFSYTIDWNPPRVARGERKLWFEIPEEIPWEPLEECDRALLASILDGMASARSLRIRGILSSRALENIDEFQEFWTGVLPGIYRRIEVVADEVRDRPEGGRGAVSAFSGGVDSLFTAYRHSHEGLGWNRRELGYAMMVHGFDIPLERKGDFDRLREKWSGILEKEGIRLVPVRTNFREVSSVSWEHSHGAALASCLSLFRRVAGIGLIGSSEPYVRPVVPWGSSPLTDHLLGVGGFRVVHDGAGFLRVSKLGTISAWKEAMEGLQVCWEGTPRDRNCGVCEKCVRTKVLFRVLGEPVPDSLGEFENPLPYLRSLRLTSSAMYNEWELVRRACLESGNTRLAGAVGALIRRSRFREAAERRLRRIGKGLPLPRGIKSLARRALTSAGFLK